MERMTINGNEILYHDNGQEMCTFRVIARAGASDEHDPADYGCAHFLEHIFFKGSESKTWHQITELGARLGDQNAYTTNERTCFHQSFVSEDFEAAGELVCDMLFHPMFHEDEFERERGVILEEYQSYLDDPLWFFSETAMWHYWGERSHRVLGRRQSVENMTQDRLQSFRDRHYKQSRMAFAVVGGIGRSRIVDFFSKIHPTDNFLQEPEAYSRDDKELQTAPFSFYHPGEQAIIGLVGTRVPMETDTRDLAARKILINGLGQGMHSMLFQRIREELGFCYRIRACDDEYRDRTAVIVYCQLDKKNVEKAHEEILNIFDKVRTDGFGDELLLTAKKNRYFNEADARKTSDGFGEEVFDQYDLTGTMQTLEYEREVIFSLTNDDIKMAAERFFPASDDVSFIKMTNEEEHKPEEYM